MIKCTACGHNKFQATHEQVFDVAELTEEGIATAELSSRTINQCVFCALCGEAIGFEELVLPEDTKLVSCVWCGFNFPTDTPRYGHDRLKAHAEICPEHPLSKAKERILELEAELARERRKTQG